MPIKLGDPLAASFDCRELLAHPPSELREVVRLDAVLTCEPTNIEQPRLDLIQTGRVEGHRLGRPRDPVLGFACFN